MLEIFYIDDWYQALASSPGPVGETEATVCNIAAQAPPTHRTPHKVRKPKFPHGIPVCVGSLERSEHKDQLQYIAVDRQVFYCIWPFVGPFCFLASCYLYQVFTVIAWLRLVHTDSAGKASEDD